MTLTPAFVEISFEQFPLLSVIFNLREIFPFRTKRFRKTVGEMKGDELRQSGFVAMRQITALVPATKTLLGIFNLWRRRPAPLALHQFAHAGVVRRFGTTRFGWLAHAED